MCNELSVFYCSSPKPLGTTGLYLLFLCCVLFWLLTVSCLFVSVSRLQPWGQPHTGYNPHSVLFWWLTKSNCLFVSVPRLLYTGYDRHLVLFYPLWVSSPPPPATPYRSTPLFCISRLEPWSSPTGRWEGLRVQTLCFTLVHTASHHCAVLTCANTLFHTCAYRRTSLCSTHVCKHFVLHLCIPPHVIVQYSRVQTLCFTLVHTASHHCAVLTCANTLFHTCAYRLTSLCSTHASRAAILEHLFAFGDFCINRTRNVDVAWLLETLTLQSWLWPRRSD